MSESDRINLVIHGAIIAVLGYLAGFPLAMVITGMIEGNPADWKFAHMEGITNNLLIFAVAGLGECDHTI